MKSAFSDQEVVSVFPQAWDQGIIAYAVGKTITTITRPFISPPKHVYLIYKDKSNQRKLTRDGQESSPYCEQ